MCFCARAQTVLGVRNRSNCSSRHTEGHLHRPQAPGAVECRVRHGMTVPIEDSTEYEAQDNGLAEVAVREVKDMARDFPS